MRRTARSTALASASESHIRESYHRGAENPLSAIAFSDGGGLGLFPLRGHSSPPDCWRCSLSGRRESDSVYLLPKQAYYRYTTPRQRTSPHANDWRHAP